MELPEAWNPNRFTNVQTVFKDGSVSVLFECRSSSLAFWAANVYGPNADSDRESFFQDLCDLKPIITGPWIIAGDFNSVRSIADRNSGHVTLAETERFNNLIRDLQVQELPLLDRNFTWSNMQVNPILNFFVKKQATP